jgi:hypothetical protein
MTQILAKNTLDLLCKIQQQDGIDMSKYSFWEFGKLDNILRRDNNTIFVIFLEKEIETVYYNDIYCWSGENISLREGVDWESATKEDIINPPIAVYRVRIMPNCLVANTIDCFEFCASEEDTYDDLIEVVSSITFNFEIEIENSEIEMHLYKVLNDHRISFTSEIIKHKEYKLD